MHGLIHANERSPATLLMMSTLTVENNLSDHVELFLLFYRYSVYCSVTLSSGKNVESYSRALLLVEKNQNQNTKYKIKLGNKSGRRSRLHM